MRAARHALLLAGLVAAAFAMAHGNARAQVRDPACGVMVFPAGSGEQRYRLPHRFVRAGSDSAWTRRGPLRRGVDYQLDAMRADLRILAGVTPGDTIWVSACWLLDPPPLEYARQVYQSVPRPGAASAPDSGARASTPRPSTGRDIANAPGGASLSVTGNKTVAVEFGSSQDAALRQSLDLAVSGTLAPGVELTGVLSDRNTPLSVAGSTQDLQSLDRVLLELRAPHASAAMGDVPLSIESGQFARLDRRVQGVRGEWHQGGFAGSVAAASSQGEYHRMQFSGVDGLQGPYTLTDRDGNSGVMIVAGSEVVTVDGNKLARGEAADYFMDYERARLTFTNRRPVTSASRITVEYQYAVTRYRRNLSAATARWSAGGVRLYGAAVTEGDDRGRPLEATIEASERALLAAAGDSLERAIGNGVTPGRGDYDSVRVAGVLAYAYVAPDSGHFGVRFARVPGGSGDYADSSIVAGRITYRYVGAGRGSFVVGRALPLPESRRLVALGGETTIGAARLEVEGALTRHDLNTASARDDADDLGGAGRMQLALEGRAPGLPGRAGVQMGARTVERRFSPFASLERPFAEEDWGLPVGADLQHQRRGDASAWWRPRSGDELRAEASLLRTPDGFDGAKRRVDWSGSGAVTTRASFLDAAGDLASRRFTRGGRRRASAEVRWGAHAVTPMLRADYDVRRTPSDSVALRDVAQEVAGELASGAQAAWRWTTGLALRRDWHEAVRTEERRATTVRVLGETPAGSPWGASVNAQRRITRERTSGARATADLASLRLRGEQRPWGLAGTFDVELTSEAENRRVRQLVFAGPGRGAYDAFGNFTGTGDYDLVLAVSPELDRLVRMATSSRSSWQFGHSEAWRGSRVDFTLENEARRRGAMRAADALLSTGLALIDEGLARAAITQRLESELAPGSHVAAMRLRAERRVNVDRSYENFAQTTDQRSGSLRWRARPGATLVVEGEGRVSWQRATQSVATGGRYARALVDEGALAQCVWQPLPRVRAAASADVSFARPLTQAAFTRTVRVGPDVGVGVGEHGRAELNLRRAFVSGPPSLSLLPSADPAGAARWDGSLRFDMRLHESTSFGLSGNVRERPGHKTLTTGRVEVRAFF